MILLPWNNENFSITVDLLMMKSQCTVIVKGPASTIIVSCLLTPLEDKYYSFKQISVNYNSFTFTRNADKKSGSRENDQDTIIARNIDRSIRPYVPEHFPYSLSIDCWQTSVQASKSKTYDEYNQLHFATSLIGANACLRLLHIISHSIMPIFLYEDNDLIVNGSMVGNKITNLEISSLGTSPKKITDWIQTNCNNYEEYKEKINELVEQTQEKILNYYPVINVIKNIKEFHRNFDDISSEKTLIANQVIKKLTEEEKKMFLEDNLSKNSEQIMYLSMDKEHQSHWKVKIYPEEIFTTIKKNLFCRKLIDTEKREDGRSFDEHRPITIEPAELSNFTQSLMVTKGKTKAIVTSYFSDNEKNYDNKSNNGNFTVKYLFNQFINPKRNSSRRETGHCSLIYKSIKNNLKDDGKNIKASCNCYILNSDGSSSMISVIGCGILLHNFQFPMEGKICGLSVGMVEEHLDKRVKSQFLVDITENEDFYCSMDMKIVANNRGIVSLQLDVKNNGITINQLKEGLLLGVQKINSLIKDVYSTNSLALLPRVYKIVIEKIKDDGLNNINNYKNFIQRSFNSIVLIDWQSNSVTVAAYSLQNLYEAQERIARDNWLSPMDNSILVGEILVDREKDGDHYACKVMHKTITIKNIELVNHILINDNRLSMVKIKLVTNKKPNKKSNNEDNKKHNDLDYTCSIVL